MDGKPAGMTANVPHGTIKFSRKEELCVAKIVAIANQKGGVGKTTTAVNLSSCVAALGKRVLIVDLDPQGNTTTGYGIPKRSVEKGTYEILIGEARASEAIRAEKHFCIVRMRRVLHSLYSGGSDSHLRLPCQASHRASP